MRAEQAARDAAYASLQSGQSHTQRTFISSRTRWA
jgi:hypothetical protein